jgi:hypothetical protein
VFSLVAAEDLTYFNLLKKKIVDQMQQSYPAISPNIEEWKGQEIVNFQEDLRLKINGQLSEKWFYTHMKTSQDKVPRIDILNLLSKYAGYRDWADFKYQNGSSVSLKVKPEQSNLYFIIVPLIVGLILIFIFFVTKLLYTREYRFCFIDADTHEPVISHPAEVTLLQDNQSPVSVLCDSTGCFKLTTGSRLLKLVIKTPYYRTDTITRVLDKFNRSETIKLRPDNYALMILYFSHSRITDWESRRARLDSMFTDNSVIYQVFDNGTLGMDILNKQEFINKLTMPVKSLHDIEILDTEYSGNKISTLKFRQKLLN